MRKAGEGGGPFPAPDRDDRLHHREGDRDRGGEADRVGGHPETPGPRHAAPYGPDGDLRGKAIRRDGDGDGPSDGGTVQHLPEPGAAPGPDRKPGARGARRRPESVEGGIPLLRVEERRVPHVLADASGAYPRGGAVPARRPGRRGVEHPTPGRTTLPRVPSQRKGRRALLLDVRHRDLPDPVLRFLAGVLLLPLVLLLALHAIGRERQHLEARLRDLDAALLA